MGADILALQVRDCAEEGGHTYVASAGKIFCELAARRPDIIETLSRADWPIQVFVFVPFNSLLLRLSHPALSRSAHPLGGPIALLLCSLLSVLSQLTGPSRTADRLALIVSCMCLSSSGIRGG